MKSKTMKAAGKASLDQLVVPPEIIAAFEQMHGKPIDASKHCEERFAYFLCGAVTAAEYEHRHNSALSVDFAAQRNDAVTGKTKGTK